MFYRLDRNQLKSLAESIAWFFPNEKTPVYYIPCEKAKGFPQASGKLYYAYINNRQRNPVFAQVKGKTSVKKNAVINDASKNIPDPEIEDSASQEGISFLSCF